MPFRVSPLNLLQRLRLVAQVTAHTAELFALGFAWYFGARAGVAEWQTLRT